MWYIVVVMDTSGVLGDICTIFALKAHSDLIISSKYEVYSRTYNN